MLAIQRLQPVDSVAKRGLSAVSLTAREDACTFRVVETTDTCMQHPQYLVAPMRISPDPLSPPPRCGETWFIIGSHLPCINLTGYSTGNGPEMEYMPVYCYEIPASCRMCTVNNGSVDISSPSFRSLCSLRRDCGSRSVCSMRT
jgi:hypothetical protein